MSENNHNPERTDDHRPAAKERCEFCAQSVADDHPHVADLATRRLLCACHACHFLFNGRGAGGGKYRSVPNRYRDVRDVKITEAQWDRLQIPVGIAFFFFNSASRRTMAFYPSPAGAMESLLPLEAWDEVAGANPALKELLPDVEALLVRRHSTGFASFANSANSASSANSDCYVVPIDACYELIGRIRRRWKGFDGGDEVRSEIESFFARLRVNSEPAKLQASGPEGAG